MPLFIVSLFAWLAFPDFGSLNPAHWPVVFVLL
jgi:hypothetical protein